MTRRKGEVAKSSPKKQIFPKEKAARIVGGEGGREGGAKSPGRRS
jgi:hypothetical protein